MTARSCLARRRDLVSPGERRPIWNWLRSLALVGLIGELVLPTARSQDRLRDFTQPILVLTPEGHHAPIRSLIFTPDGRKLLTGGSDKVVNVWDLKGNRPILGATIRPPIWRGPAGNINALALAPKADERGQRILAVAGYGVASRRGNIALFRFPGSPAVRTGDHFAQLLNDDPTQNDDPDRPDATGHADVVTSLAFNPSGTLLASGSNDATARIWDWKNGRTTAVLKGHQGPILVVAFTPDGKFLVTGGRDGVVRLWDPSRPDAPAAASPTPAQRADDPLGIQINALAVSNDGLWVVIGREDGRVIRYNARTLRNERVLSARDETIEALALSHDGARLVTTTIGRLKSRDELPRLACTVNVLNMPDGSNPRAIHQLDNIAYACGFSPDDRTIAVAGGDDQATFLIKNWDDARKDVVAMKGTGRSIWDVGLQVDPRGRLAVGFAQDADQNPAVPAPAAGRPARRYRGFILASREITTFDPAELSRGLRQFDGWTIRPIDQFRLSISRGNRSFTIALDEDKDRRWMSYSFIPPGPDHIRPAVAVGCDSGVWFYRLEDGRPTRLYSGHSGPVYCLAPSKDGRWLATGSSDQTVRLWPLAGCDTPPTLGAKFDRLPDGTHVVSEVTPLGFADYMGLNKGDVPTKFALGGKTVAEADFFARYESQPPNSRIEVIVRRKSAPAGKPAVEEVIALGTSRRDNPAVSLFVGTDQEWVVWMPSGYYDTSIAGDAKLLGWHINQSKLFPARPTDFLEIIKFEKAMRQPKRSRPNKLDTLLETGNLALALTVPFPPVAIRVNPAVPAVAPPPSRWSAPSDLVRDLRPPKLEPTITPLPRQTIRGAEGEPVDVREALPEKIAIDGEGAAANMLNLTVKIDSEGRSPAKRIKLEMDGRTVRNTTFDQPIALRQEAIMLAVSPGPHRFSAEVQNVEGYKRSMSRDIFVRGRRAKPGGRLKILTLAPVFQERRIPPIRYAERDVKDMRTFFKKYLVSPLEGNPLQVIEDPSVDGPSATVERVLQSFQSLKGETLDEDDLVVVVIESHLLNIGQERKVVAADGHSIPPDPSIPADELAYQLGEVAQSKCRVLVLLDGVHTRSSDVWDTEINEWVRHLRDEYNVITFVASNSGPSRALNDRGHRAFAQAVIDSVRPPFSPDGPISFGDFRDRVVDDVLSLTGRQQQAACYLPESLSGEFPLLDPRPPKR